jgi:hypothetical protein
LLRSETNLLAARIQLTHIQPALTTARKRLPEGGRLLAVGPARGREHE